MARPYDSITTYELNSTRGFGRQRDVSVCTHEHEHERKGVGVKTTAFTEQVQAVLNLSCELFDLVVPEQHTSIRHCSVIPNLHHSNIQKHPLDSLIAK
jgi:hypothetical protein